MGHPAAMFRTLIVDDDGPSRTRVRHCLRDIDDVDVIGECASGPAAVEMIRDENPDLVFLDIEMAGLGGFEVVRETRAAGCSPAVIFITAHEEFARRAFDVDAVDYLVKPFAEERFQAAVERARRSLAALPPSPRAGGRRVSRILAKHGHRTVVLPADDVAWLRAADNYVEIYVRKQKYLVRCTLGELEAQLDTASFVRVHRSAIVNIRHLAFLSPLVNKDRLATLHDGTELVVSRTYYDRLMTVLAG
jgi:two-component system, LytTR family, response regulator